MKGIERPVHQSGSGHVSKKNAAFKTEKNPGKSKNIPSVEKKMPAKKDPLNNWAT